MAGMAHGLLALPPCMRRQAFLAASNPLPLSSLHAIGAASKCMPQRTFASTDRNARDVKARTATRTAAPIRQRQEPLPYKAPASARPAPMEPVPHARSANHSLAESYGKRLLDHTDGKSVLLYEAPHHGTFFALSYFSSALLLIYAGNQLNFILTSSVTTWVSMPAMLGSILIGGGSWLLAAAPSKLVKTIRVVPQERVSRGVVTTTPVLEIQARAMVPFVKQKPFTAPMDQVTLDRRVAMTIQGAIDVPMSDAAVWSKGEAGYSPPTLGQKALAWNRSLINVVPAFMRDMRRMARRDGMAYMDVMGRGTWKVDLQGAKLLEQGHPLTRLMQEEIPVQGSAWHRIRRALVGA